MTINLKTPDIRELKPHIIVFGVGGAGGNAVNNMISAGLEGCEFIVANTDAQALNSSKSKRVIQMGIEATQGLGAGSHPEVGRAAAEEVIDEIRDHLAGAHMAFITAGMGGGTGTGAAPVIARVTRELGILTVGVVTKPFQFEGQRRMIVADAGIQELAKHVDTLIVIPNQNLFRVANEKTTFADAFAMADQVLYSGVACITDLMVKEGLINLDFADVRTVMRDMGKAMMGTGEATGEKRAITAAEAAIANPLLDETSMRGAKGLLISISGGQDLTLYEVDEAASRIREEVDADANIILGATFDQSLDGIVRVSVVATGIDGSAKQEAHPSGRFSAASVAGRMAVARAFDETHEAPRTPQSYRQPAPAPHAARREHLHDDAHEQETAIDDVTIRPLPPRPSFFEPMQDEGPAEEHAEEPARPFLPPRPERAGVVRAPRMPRVDELPVPAQNEIRASRGETTEHQSLERKRMSLLQRLAQVGLGRREDKDDGSEAQEPAVAASDEGALRGAPERRTQEQVSEYTRRPAGRPAAADSAARPGRTRIEEDELEIPAFLRRQAN
ncbi:MAG: cell division protein FtsZ [Bradyrhizobiaceae bacterium]|nr:cell division protein FtsZ [Bradyrhizobiaceae bacterium]